jgi:hypothetical protein
MTVSRSSTPRAADFVNAGPEVDDVWIVRTGRVRLRRIPEQVQRADPRIVDLARQVTRLVQLNRDGLAVEPERACHPWCRPFKPWC